jgi:hypothetical protein
MAIFIHSGFFHKLVSNQAPRRNVSKLACRMPICLNHDHALMRKKKEGAQGPMAALNVIKGLHQKAYNRQDI